MDVNNMKTVTCKRCGMHTLVWAQSKKGNWYLTYWRQANRAFKPAHDCVVRNGRLTEKRARLIVRELIITTAEEQAEAQEMVERLEKERLEKGMEG